MKYHDKSLNWPPPPLLAVMPFYKCRAKWKQCSRAAVNRPLCPSFVVFSGSCMLVLESHGLFTWRNFENLHVCWASLLKIDYRHISKKTKKKHPLEYVNADSVKTLVASESWHIEKKNCVFCHCGPIFRIYAANRWQTFLFILILKYMF